MLLQFLFYQNNVWSDTFQTHPNKLYLKNCLWEVVPSNICFKNFISYVYKKYNCDILILDIDDSVILNRLKKTFKFDIEILSNKTKRKKKVDLIRNEDDTVFLEISKVISKKTIVDVYKMIIKVLNGYEKISLVSWCIERLKYKKL
jgi:hypothetical protein